MNFWVLFLVEKGLNCLKMSVLLLSIFYMWLVFILLCNYLKINDV